MHTFLTDAKIVHVTEHDRHVDYGLILDSVSIEYGGWHNETPWDAYDGFEHDYVPARHCDFDVENARGYGYSVANREAFVITISDEQLKSWGNYDYFRANGCSKQVAMELTAQVKRETLDQLVEWYSNGWCWYYVSGEYEGYSASIGGVDCLEYAEELRYEIADEIADEMEDAGYIVEGRHNPYEKNKSDSYKICRKQQQDAFVIN